MKRIAVAAQKGGSGKTTAAVNLAAALGEKGKRVLVVDLDSQASASGWLGIREGGRGLFDALASKGELRGHVMQTQTPGVDIVPGSSWLAGLEKALSREVGAETILRQRLEALPRSWDFVLMDCPPSLGVLTIMALVAAQSVLIPVETHVLALSGLAQMLETVELVRERLNPGLRIAGILACRVDARTRHAGEIVGLLRERFKDKVFQTAIRESVRLAECPSFGKSILAYESGSRGAEDFRALARELLQRS